MNISYTADQRLFRLDTAGTTYAMMVGPDGELRHCHFGARLGEGDEAFVASLADSPLRRSFSPGPENLGEPGALNKFALEFSGFGSGDYRMSMLQLRNEADGCNISLPRYAGHQIHDGKAPLPGLPASFAPPADCRTLEITMRDAFSGVEAILCYSVFADSDVIARSVRIRNCGSCAVTLTRALSAQLDLPDADYDIIYAHSIYGSERHLSRQRLHGGTQGFDSRRGSTGHQHNPSVVLATPGTTESLGEAYGLLLVYSSNYLVQAEVDEVESTRLSIGINPDGFAWRLEPGESFQTPEALLIYSANGLDGLSTQSHAFITKHIIRSPWKDRRRPILINNWEATYFDFNEEKLLALGRKAASLGIEMLVLDDGWFGKRNNDLCGLGDWFVNTEKLPDFAGMVRKLNDMGIKFGLWFEPEMISPDSDLYRAHPDWALCVPGKPRCLGRHQLVLDFSRPEVVDGIYAQMAALLRTVHIEYIKWDMNRSLSEVFSASLPPERQGEVPHRYVMGVYRLAEMLLAEFPELLIEGCSGGGGRYDAGILHYCPQIWCSDDSDALQRIPIQMGTSLFYPPASMGAHVSVCPNHQTGRVVSWQFRADVAAAGTFGYELDITKFTSEEDEVVRQQIIQHKADAELIRKGIFHRLTEGFGLTPTSAWCWTLPDGSAALATILRSASRPFGYNPELRLRLPGLRPAVRYRIEETGQCATGATIMHAGIRIAGILSKDATSCRFHLTAIG